MNGLFKWDSGNSPTFEYNVKLYGAKGDGTTDDTFAIQGALAAGDNIYFPEGTYKITSSLTLTQGHNIRGASNDGTSIKVSGAITAFDITEQICTIRDLAIVPFAGSEQLYTGISAVSSYHHIENVLIFQPAIGIILEGNAFFCHLSSILITFAGQKGIWLRGKTIGALFEIPQNNFIQFKELLGNSKEAGSIGIYIDNGMSNIFIGGTTDQWETGIQIDVGTATQINTNNRFMSIWVEFNTTGIVASEGINYFDGISIDPINTSGTAELITPQQGFGSYLDIASPRPNMQNLNALYLFDEGTGTNIRDYSGNNRHATAIGGTWVSGIYGNALKFDNISNNEYLTIPTTAIDPANPYTVAILWYPNTLMATNNVLFRIDQDGSGTHFNYWLTHGDVANTIYYLMSTSLGGGASIASMRHTDTSRWTWLFFTYNPTTGVCTSLDPVYPGNKITVANDVSSIYQIYLHINWQASHFIATYQLCAIWQRELSQSEARQFINSIQPIVPPGSFLTRHANGLTIPASAAATTLGSVAKKIQVFDESGISLGYIALYDAIT